MLDLEGKELEIGAIYILPGNSGSLCVGIFSHETSASFIFKPIVKSRIKVGFLYSWKRAITKFVSNDSIPVIRASQEVLDKYQIA